MRRVGWTAEVVRRAGAAHGVWGSAQLPLVSLPRGFELMRRRWVVERTFGWLGRYRRLSKDYEATIESSAAWLWVAFIRILVSRLADD
jgi:transposase